jgi:hypothetical protein
MTSTRSGSHSFWAITGRNISAPKEQWLRQTGATGRSCAEEPDGVAHGKTSWSRARQPAERTNQPGVSQSDARA